METSEAHVPGERAQPLQPPTAIRVLAVDRRPEQGRQPHADLGVPAVHEDGILGPAAGNHRDGEVCPVPKEVGQAGGDRVPAAADRARAPGDVALADGGPGGQPDERDGHHEDPAVLHSALAPPRIRGTQCTSCRRPTPADRMMGAVPPSVTRTVAFLLVTGLAAACVSSPVGVARVDPSDVHRRLTRSALSTGDVSLFTRNVLLEANLADLFDEDPEKALERLHDLAVSGSGGPRQLFAVAEASFLHAERTDKRSYHLATALYAWAFLFPEDASETPSPFDPRLGLAANLYNRGLTSALVAAEDGRLVLRSGTLELPFGQLLITFDPDQLVWHG